MCTYMRWPLIDYNCYKMLRKTSFFIKIIILLSALAFTTINGQQQGGEIENLAATNQSCGVSNCQVCTTSPNTICDQCDGDLIFDSTACKCESGFYLSSGSSCSQCINNCDVCSSSSNCDACHQGTFYNGSSCASCSSNCQICSAANDCTTCQNGYTENNGACTGNTESVSGTFTTNNQEVVQCPSGCSECSSATSCSKCIDGYYISNSNCFPCDNSCQTCNGGTASSCTGCESGLFLSNNQCRKCSDPNCLTCSFQQFCSECAQGYGVSDGSCVRCSSFCISCGIDATVCVECEKGHIVIDDQCVECVQGCGVCDANDLSNCLSCNDGYYRNQNQNICLNCPAGCLTCTSATVCQTCEFGFKLVNNKCLPSCRHPCSQCVDGQPAQCTSCFGGYTLSGNTCSSNPCSSSCSFCPRNFFIDNSNSNACSRCPSINNCVSCIPSDSSKCGQCAVGFYLSSNACAACPSQCSSCSTPGRCDSCADGYYLEYRGGSSTGKCRECGMTQYFCATCIYSASQCQSCLNGYKLQGIKCISDINIDLVLELDTTRATYTRRSNAFKNGFFNTLGQPYQNNIQWFTSNNVNDGSVILGSTVTVPSNTSAEDTLTNVQNSLANNNQYGGIRLISSSATLDDGSESASTETNLALILGLSIPLLLVLLSLILIIKTNMGKKVQEEEDDQVVESNSQFMDDNKAI